MKKYLYVDMDGTLAQFQKKPLEEITSKGYFRDLPVMVNVVKALRTMMKENDDVIIMILTSVFNDNHSISDKKCWLHEVIPEITEEQMIFVPYGERKSDYVDQKDSFLLDDFSKNLHEWEGIGIKVYNGINGNNGTWHGYSIHSDMEPEKLKKQLLGILRAEPKGGM